MKLVNICLVRACILVLASYNTFKFEKYCIAVLNIMLTADVSD